MKVLEVPTGFALSFPSDACCNCGASGPVELVPTPLLLTRFFGWGGVEYKLAERGVPIPHCATCRVTSGRLRPGCAGLLVSWGALSVLLGIVLALLLVVGGEAEAMEHALWAGPAAGLLLSLGWRLTRRPPGSAVSYHQAVWVVGLQQRFTGQVLAWRLGFANDAYAARVLATNPSLAPPP